MRLRTACKKLRLFFGGLVYKGRHWRWVQTDLQHSFKARAPRKFPSPGVESWVRWFLEQNGVLSSSEQLAVLSRTHPSDRMVRDKHHKRAGTPGHLPNGPQRLKKRTQSPPIFGAIKSTVATFFGTSIFKVWLCLGRRPVRARTQWPARPTMHPAGQRLEPGERLRA